jgi:hypothetical protein
VTRAAVLAVALLATARGAAAQQDSGAVQSVQRDSATKDTAARDTTKRDTLPHYLPVLPSRNPDGPLPAGTRYSFTADSFDFSDTRTLADLLGHIPGVYVARGAQWGGAEAVLYGGRGPAAIEVYWDGVPYLPLGRDSVYLDVGRIPLAPLERVDVIVLPASLRVYLTTLRQSSTAPSSAIGLTTGTLSTTAYRADFLKRWPSGLGLSLLADWGGLTGPQGTSTTSFNDVNLWFQGAYIPTPRFGVTYSVTSVDWSRASSVAPDVNAGGNTRVDEMARVFWGARTDATGPRLDLILARSSVTGDTLVPNEGLSQASLALSDVGSRTSAKLTTSTAGARVPLTLQGEVGWTPLEFLTVSADLRHAKYSFDRTGNRAHATAGLKLPLGFSAHGDIAWTSDLAASILPSDTVQTGTDLYGALRFEHSWGAFEVGGARRSGFTPPPGFLDGLSTIQELGPTPPTNYLSVQALLRPLPGLELSAWYFNPVRGGGDFEPPQHARYSATFYSKFWRTYKSGVFACRIEAAAESWSGEIAPGGGLAVDSTGTAMPYTLAGATFVDLNVEIRVVGVTIFWTVRNARAARTSYVPALDYLSNYQVYGVLWRFTN